MFSYIVVAEYGKHSVCSSLCSVLGRYQDHLLHIRAHICDVVCVLFFQSDQKKRRLEEWKSLTTSPL
jgi:hypothetical protein